MWLDVTNSKDLVQIIKLELEYFRNSYIEKLYLNSFNGLFLYPDWLNGQHSELWFSKELYLVLRLFTFYIVKLCYYATNEGRVADRLLNTGSLFNVDCQCWLGGALVP